MPDQDETLLGFDFGSSRIGAAVGNTLTASARPLAQIDNRVSARGFDAIGRLL
jgi:putative Holliday junction resolvase